MHSATWSAMRSLQSLDLSISIPREKRSLLSGGLPVAWRNMVNLTTLNLARTNISGIHALEIFTRCTHVYTC